jgi:flagellar FliL protein
MSEAEATAGAGGEAAAPRPAPKSKLIPLLLIVNTALMGGVLFLVLKRPAAAPAAPGGEAAGAEAHEGGAAETDKSGKRVDSNKPGPILPLEPFVIQVRAADMERYLRITFNLEIITEADKDPILDRMPLLRDSVIAYFSDRTLDELRGSDGIERLKSAILKRFDDIVPGRRVRNLYITEFVTQ